MVEYNYYMLSDHEFVVVETYNREVSYKIASFDNERDAQTFTIGLSSMTV